MSKRYLKPANQLLSIAAFLLCCILFNPVAAFSFNPDPNLNRAVQGVDCPVVTLTHWQKSEASERYSFLIGFMTMLELEQEWQGNPPLPPEQSRIGQWVKGLGDVPITTVYERINKFMAANPSRMDMSVVEVMWREFVLPKIAQDTSATEPKK